MATESGLPGSQNAEEQQDLPAVLTALLSSRVRYKLLALFLAGQDTPRHARQLTKDTGEHFNSVWQELRNLQSLGILASKKAGNQVHYQTDPAFPLLPELRMLFRKAEGQATAEAPAGETRAAESPSEGPASIQPPPPAASKRPEVRGRGVASFVIGEVD